MHRRLLAMVLTTAAVGQLGCPPVRPSAAQTRAEEAQENADLARIERLETERSLGDGFLVSASADARPAIAVAALRALGRLQQSAAVPAVVRAFASPRAAVREEAAAAAVLLSMAVPPIGNAERSALEQAVGAAEAAESDVPARLAELRALGALGTPDTLARLVERLVGPGELRAEAALQLGIAAANKRALPADAVEPLGALSASEDESQRRAATYALTQLGRTEALPALRERAQDSDAEVRAWAVLGLRQGALHDSGRLANLALRERDPRVRAELARALAHHARQCLPATACNAILLLEEMLEPLSGLRGRETAFDAWPLLVLAEEPLPPVAHGFWVRVRGRLDALARATPGRARAAGQLDCAAAAALSKLEVLPRVAGAAPGPLECGLGEVSEPERAATWRPGASSPSSSLAAAVPAGSGDEGGGDTRVVLVTELGEVEIVLEPEAPLGTTQLLTQVAEGAWNGAAVARASTPRLVEWSWPAGRPLPPAEPIATPVEAGMLVRWGDRVLLARGWAPELQGKASLLGRVVGGMIHVRALLPGSRVTSARVERP